MITLDVCVSIISVPIGESVGPRTIPCGILELTSVVSEEYCPLTTK